MTESSMTDAVAERSVLGAVLMSTDALDAVQERGLVAADFTAAHGLIFGAASAIREAGAKPNLVTVHARLRDSGELEAAGGLPYLSALLDACPAVAPCASYADIVVEKSKRRTLRAKLQDALDTMNGETPAPALARALSVELSDLAGGDQRRGLRPLSAVAKEWCDTADKRQFMRPVATGFYELDDMLGGGFHPGNLILLAGRPGTGKTTLALSIALNATGGGAFTSLFSLEMNDHELFSKMLCGRTGADLHRVRVNKLRPDEMAKLSSAVSALSDSEKYPLHIDDRAGHTIVGIAATARRQKHRIGMDLLILDYLQLLTPIQRRNGSRNDEVADMSRGLKLLAKDLKVPILALSQLNRAGAEGRPGLHNLRDSGSLEQDADVVLFLYAEDENNPEHITVEIAKNRLGPVGAVHALFQKQAQRFVNAAVGG